MLKIIATTAERIARKVVSPFKLFSLTATHRSSKTYFPSSKSWCSFCCRHFFSLSLSLSLSLPLLHKSSLTQTSAHTLSLFSTHHISYPFPLVSLSLSLSHTHTLFLYLSSRQLISLFAFLFHAPTHLPTYTHEIYFCNKNWNFVSTVPWHMFWSCRHTHTFALSIWHTLTHTH